MRFAHPVAWLGLVLLALPIAVHMLVRNRAPLRRLATLRFLTGEPPVAIRRSRPDELRLLLLRMAIVALAVAALARPHLPSVESPDGSTLGASALPNRAVLVDESWSMLRPLAAPDQGGPTDSAAPAGPTDSADPADPTDSAGSAGPTSSAGSADRAGSALARARELAAEATADARASTVITFGAKLPLEVAIEGAAAWLLARPGPGEIVLVSDFQRGTLEAARGVALPERLGLVPIAIEVDAEGAAPFTYLLRDGSARAAAVVVEDGGEVGPDVVRLTWSRPTDTGPAAATPGPPATEVELIFPDAPADSLRASATHSSATGSPSTLSPDAASFLLRLASDRTLAAAAAEDQGPTDSAPEGPDGELVVARDRTGRALLTAGAAPSSGLWVQSRVPPGSLTAAALRVAVARASHPSPPGKELEPRFDDAEHRASWARVPGPGDAEDSEATAPGAARWAWILVLVLLVVETLYRRRIHAHRR